MAPQRYGFHRKTQNFQAYKFTSRNECLINSASNKYPSIRWSSKEAQWLGIFSWSYCSIRPRIRLRRLVEVQIIYLLFCCCHEHFYGQKINHKHQSGLVSLNYVRLRKQSLLLIDESFLFNDSNFHPAVNYETFLFFSSRFESEVLWEINKQKGRENKRKLLATLTFNLRYFRLK